MLGRTAESQPLNCEAMLAILEGNLLLRHKTAIAFSWMAKCLDKSGSP